MLGVLAAIEISVKIWQKTGEKLLWSHCFFRTYVNHYIKIGYNSLAQGTHSDYS